MLRALVLSCAMLLPQAALNGQASDLTLPPETATTVTLLEGRGVQIYTCTADATGRPHWMLTAPEAQLFNLATGKAVGKHTAGPTWTLDDGSALRGTVLQIRTADSSRDVPWLLLRAEPTGATQGMLSNVTYVRRYDTHGGTAPAAGCDAAHTGQTHRAPYSAIYGFYALPQ